MKYVKPQIISVPQPKPVSLSLPGTKFRRHEKISLADMRNQLVGIKHPEATIARPKPIILPPAAESNTPILRLSGSGLVDPDFVFDDSQIEAITSISTQKYANLIGAAGSGKTTCEKAFVQHIAAEIKSIDLEYYKRAKNEEKEIEHQEVMGASILLCAYTGKAVRQIMKNFPREWHKNIMTIHRALRYAPVMVEKVMPDGTLKTVRHFEPMHDSNNKMPWDVIIIDEASMLALDLWSKLRAAMRPATRVYMIGDLNQLPPTQGRSVFGYALAKWPTSELTHIHRQKGSKDEIVPNAHRILRGELPIDGVNVKLKKIDQNPAFAAKQIVHYVKQLAKAGQYDERFDSVITAVNGHNWESLSAPLGQIPLNEPLARFFNPEARRLVIDAGRSRKVFALGDKVMATKNDYENEITNGMMGLITEITESVAYVGDRSMIGDFDKVQASVKEMNETFGGLEGDELTEAMAAKLTEKDDGKVTESFLTGAASHSITVDFSACEVIGADDESGKHLVTLRTRGEVESLMLAYASTCHKLQGSECPTTIVVVHEAFKQMLCREWLYTACTRASQKMLILYTQRGLEQAVYRQRIKGKSVKEKAEQFRRLTEQAKGNAVMASFTVDLPEPQEVEITKKESTL